MAYEVLEQAVDSQNDGVGPTSGQGAAAQQENKLAALLQLGGGAGKGINGAQDDDADGSSRSSGAEASGPEEDEATALQQRGRYKDGLLGDMDQAAKSDRHELSSLASVSDVDQGSKTNVIQKGEILESKASLSNVGTKLNKRTQ